jgi:VanZ family protein
MQIRTKILKLWLPVIVWAGVIFSFSSMAINKDVSFSWLDFVVKKTAHVVEYFILYWLLFRASSEGNKKINKKVFVWSMIVVIFYALSDEWHQTFVPGREGTLRDVGFDTIGVLLSATLIKRNL